MRSEKKSRENLHEETDKKVAIKGYRRQEGTKVTNHENKQETKTQTKAKKKQKKQTQKQTHNTRTRKGEKNILLNKLRKKVKAVIYLVGSRTQPRQEDKAKEND